MWLLQSFNAKIAALRGEARSYVRDPAKNRQHEPAAGCLPAL
jgi:hypothetical protein